jgi:hypothetical protein
MAWATGVSMEQGMCRATEDEPSRWSKGCDSQPAYQAHAAFDMPLNSTPPTITPEAFDLKKAAANCGSRTEREWM